MIFGFLQSLVGSLSLLFTIPLTAFIAATVLKQDYIAGALGSQSSLAPRFYLAYSQRKPVKNTSHKKCQFIIS